MRQTISGLVAAVAVMSAAPAMACGGGLFGTGCSPCAQSYVGGCARSGLCRLRSRPTAAATPAAAAGPPSGCADPEQQYYYVNQGPTYTGPGNWAPRPTYQEGYVSGSYGYGSRSYYGYDGRLPAPASVRPALALLWRLPLCGPSERPLRLRCASRLRVALQPAGAPMAAVQRALRRLRRRAASLRLPRARAAPLLLITTII